MKLLLSALFFTTLFFACIPTMEDSTPNSGQNLNDTDGVNDTDVVVDTNTISDTTAANVTWNLTAVGYRTSPNNTRITYVCPANGTLYPVWGTDTYTDDSSVCTAAVHAGKITLAAGGRVVIQLKPGQTAYASSTRNGVPTYAYGTWGYSYIFP